MNKIDHFCHQNHHLIMLSDSQSEFIERINVIVNDTLMNKIKIFVMVEVIDYIASFQLIIFE
jgi:hypothetical protein